MDNGREDKLLITVSKFILAALLKHTNVDPSALDMQPIYKAVFQVNDVRYMKYYLTACVLTQSNR